MDSIIRGHWLCFVDFFRRQVGGDIMKRLLIGAATLAVLLSGCTGAPNPAGGDEETLPAGFETITVTKGYYNVYEMRHLETGCHVIFSSESGMTPLYGEDGKPYCTEEY
jgi:hypothetical protein